MTTRKPPKWYDQLLAEQADKQARAKEDARWNAYLSREGIAYSFEAAGADLWSAFSAAFRAGEPWIRYYSTRLSAKAIRRAGFNVEEVLASRTPEEAVRESDGALPHCHFEFDLDPREATRWLLSKPEYHHLVPAGLTRVVLLDANIQPDVTATAAPTEKPKRRRGRKPNKRNRVLLAMRSMPISVLRVMPEKEMEARFGASRFTCRAAKRMRESEFSDSD